MKLIKNLRPNTIADFIGIIIIAWTLSPALLFGDIISLNSTIFRFFAIPSYIANTILIPLPKDLGALAVGFYNVLLLVGIIFLFVLFINKTVYKTTSFAIIWWTLLLVLVATVSMKIDAELSSQKYANEMDLRTNIMDSVKIKTKDCAIEPSNKKRRITCNITLYNMPAVTNNPGVLIYLSFAEENTANERYSLGHAPFGILENTDNTTFQGNFTLLLMNEATDPMRVYIEGIEMHAGFDKYFTSMLKHPLY